MITYGILGGMAFILAYNMVATKIASKPPPRVPTDGQIYDRKTQTYK